LGKFTFTFYPILLKAVLGKLKTFLFCRGPAKGTGWVEKNPKLIKKLKETGLK